MGKLMLQAHKILVFSGSWDPILQKITPFLSQTQTFLQSVSVGIVTCMAIYFEIRSVAADQQEEAMYNSRVKKVMTACVIIFLIPTLVAVLKGFFA